MHTNRWAPYGLLAGLAFGTLNAAAQNYAITDLGTLTDRTSNARGLNENGEVVGFSAVSGGSVIKDGEIIVFPWHFHAVLWSGGVLQDLGVLNADSLDSEAVAVNTEGHVAGFGDNGSGEFRAILWLQAPAFGLPAGPNQLPGLTGDEAPSKAFGLNEETQIVGESRSGITNGPAPVLWNYEGNAGWQVSQLPSLGGPYGRAIDINNLGQICGQANVPSGSLAAFIYLPESAYGLSAGIHNLQAGTSSSATPEAINDLGQIVGRIGVGTAFVWLPEAAYGLPSGTSILQGFPPGSALTQAYDINNQGQIVGEVYIVTGTTPSGDPILSARAFLWQEGEIVLLEDHIDGDAGWAHLQSAQEINDAGQIAGWGEPADEPDGIHAFLMDVLPGNPADLNGDGMVNASDLALLLGSWGPCPPQGSCAGDINADGVVDAGDLALLLGSWGT